MLRVIKDGSLVFWLPGKCSIYELRQSGSDGEIFPLKRKDADGLF